MLTNLEALRLLFLITYANSVAVPVTDSGDQSTSYHTATSLSTPPPSVSTHGRHDYYTTAAPWFTHSSEAPAKHSDEQAHTSHDVYTETTPSPFDVYSDTGNTPRHHASSSDSYTDESDYYSDSVSTGNHYHYGSAEDKTTSETPSSPTPAPSASSHGRHDAYTTAAPWFTHSSEAPAEHSDEQAYTSHDVYTETTPSPFDVYSDTGYFTYGHSSLSGLFTDREKPFSTTPGPDEDAEDYRDGEEAFPIQQSTGNPPLYDLGLTDNKDEQEKGSDAESDSDSSDDDEEDDDDDDN